MPQPTDFCLLVVTLSRDHIRGARLEKRAIKNHRIIRLELPSSVIEALDLKPTYDCFILLRLEIARF